MGDSEKVEITNQGIYLKPLLFAYFLSRKKYGQVFFIIARQICCAKSIRKKHQKDQGTEKYFGKDYLCADDLKNKRPLF
ncbi:MAG: hypothetical protein ACXVO9_10565 [Bacteroidia bacterium]